MAGAVVAVVTRRVVMALATLVCTAVSNPAASVMSALVPPLTNVDHSLAAGSALNVNVPLPPGPTEIAARAPKSQPTASMVRENKSLFIGRQVKGPGRNGNDSVGADRTIGQTNAERQIDEHSNPPIQSRNGSLVEGRCGTQSRRSSQG